MKRICFAALGLVCAASAHAKDSVPVTVDNYNHAASDVSMASVVKTGAFGRLVHGREPQPIDEQGVVRPSRDTLNSVAVFDLDAGPATVTMPDAGKRFMSMQIIDEDNYTPAIYYGAGSHTLTKDDIGTRYVLVVVRTLVDADDPEDVAQVHTLQDAIKVRQTARGKFEVPNWEDASLLTVRGALLTLGERVDSKRTYGRRSEVDPIHHLIGTAVGWGGNPESAVVYALVTPARNDNGTVYELDVPGKVPVDGFWSISVYNAEGHFQRNDFDAYSLNSFAAKKGPDGSVAVQFGGCDGKIPNCLPTPGGWNYAVRMYRPREEILNGNWKFPEAQPAN
jgi:hypothetical protein